MFLISSLSLGTKVVVTTGNGFGAKNTEIINLEEASFRCTVSQFPTSVSAATGGLVGNTPIICGGGIGDNSQASCYSLKEDGAWKDEADLIAARRSASTGSVIIKNKLVIAGGYDEGNLDTIEVVAPNAKSQTLTINLPVAMHAPCIVPWDIDTFMVIGGNWRIQTLFIHTSNNSYTEGPKLLKGRHWTGCNTIDINGEDYIVVAGSEGASSKSTEVLQKANFASGWKESKNYTDL